MDTLLFPLSIGGVSALGYGAAYYRYRLCKTALGPSAEQLALAPRNASKWERFGHVATLTVAGAAVVQAYFKGWDTLLPALAHICLPHAMGETQRLAMQLWVSKTGFVHSLNFIPWTQVESVTWDKDVGQQLYGTTFRYTLKGRTKTLKLWVPRDRKEECEERLESLRLPSSGHALSSSLLPSSNTLTTKHSAS